MEALRTPDDRFAALPDFAFAPHYLEVPDGEGGTLRVHYVDEGPPDVDPVLLLHGEPSWSFLYRKMVPVITAAGIRAVVPDLVDVFRRHDDLPSVLDETVAVGAKTLWLQLGLWHEDVARGAEAAGLDVVMNRCLKIEHARFHGGLHLAGFNTGVISSRHAEH